MYWKSKKAAYQLWTGSQILTVVCRNLALEVFRACYSSCVPKTCDTLLFFQYILKLLLLLHMTLVSIHICLETESKSMSICYEGGKKTALRCSLARSSIPEVLLSFADTTRSAARAACGSTWETCACRRGCCRIPWCTTTWQWSCCALSTTSSGWEVRLGGGTCDPKCKNVYFM